MSYSDAQLQKIIDEAGEGDFARLIAKLSSSRGAAVFKTENNPTGMFARVEDWTPERQASVLDSYENVRNITTSRVEAYANDFRNGDFVLTHQGMGFGANEVFCDGGHRLSAGLRAGVSFSSFTAYNIPPEGCVQVDRQQPRSSHVCLSAAAYECSRADTLLAKQFESFPGYNTAIQTPAETRRIIERHGEAFAFVDDNMRPSSSHTNPYPVAVKCSIGRAFYYARSHGQLDRLQEFCCIVRTGSLSDGEMPKESDRAAVKYREYLMRTRISGSFLIVDCYRKGQSAIAAFFAGRSLQTLSSTDRDLYPLPQSSSSSNMPRLIS